MAKASTQAFGGTEAAICDSLMLCCSDALMPDNVIQVVLSRVLKTCLKTLVASLAAEAWQGAGVRGDNETLL